MRLYYIRHAQSVNNAIADRTGSDAGRSVDAPLTDVGIRQAQLLAEYLAAPASGVDPPGMDSKDIRGFGITHLYCSLMDRAIATGTFVAKALDLPLVGVHDIHESGGIYEDDPQTGAPNGMPGRTRRELLETYPHLQVPDAVGEEGWWNRPFEEKEERPLRAFRVLRWLRERHGDTNHHVAMVSHGGFFNWLMAQIIGIQQPESLWLHMNNTAVSRVDISSDFTVVQYMNRTDHLPLELVT